jgi:hypothetical protein
MIKTLRKNKTSLNIDPLIFDIAKISEEPILLTKARRTAFIARFIVLRESKRTRAHRVIEQLEWHDETTAEELCERFRSIFSDNGDNMEPVNRDLRRALAHANRSLTYFVREYADRATKNFIDALFDYERSNLLLFRGDEKPKPGGWLLPSELKRSIVNIDANHYLE